MRNDRFEVFRMGAFSTPTGWAYQGLCSICLGKEKAEWMKGGKAYCNGCKIKTENKESDNLRVTNRQMDILRLMALGAELHEDLEPEGSSFINNSYEDNERLELEPFIERLKLERKGLIRHHRNIGSTYYIYQITDKGTRAFQRRAGN